MCIEKCVASNIWDTEYIVIPCSSSLFLLDMLDNLDLSFPEAFFIKKDLGIA
jgi:hypothetical protein